MKLTLSKPNGQRLRLLVAIASFGEKNLEFLKRIIHRYRSMDMDVKIIVNSEAQKNFEDGVEVIVGLPSRNPHSLPFAHKRIFVENVDRYDLFIYTEDDIEVTEEHIAAFINVTAELPPNEIAGFIRFEIDQNSTIFLPDVHGRFHWNADSVRYRGQHLFAEFTNEHAGFYILTQTQLKRAIDSGGYFTSPYEGKYQMLESAATDPYTRCGFQKVICISDFEKFLIHHMPNTYAGKMGQPLSCFKKQIKTLIDIWRGIHPSSKLCEVEPKVLQRNWYKSYYENYDGELLSMVPREAKTILSVGCGWGATEAELYTRGSKITALALDSVIGAVAENRGLEMVYGTIDEGLQILKGRKFDCVLITNLLHLLPDPWRVLMDYSQLVENGGKLVISGPNFEFFPHWANRLLCLGDYYNLRDFGKSGLHPHGIRTIKTQIGRAGFTVISLRWFNFAQPRAMLMLQRWPKRMTARNWVIQARHKP